MGLLTEAVTMLMPRGGSTKQAAGSAVPTWQSGNPQYPVYNYERFARDGYSRNEIVFACIEELASSASEPRLAGYRIGQPDPEKVDTHPGLDLMNHPNPFISRYAFMAAIVMHRSLAGNAFIEKVRSRADNVVEFWLLRPDRVKIIPDSRDYIRGYEYRIGNDRFFLDARDVIHIKGNNPLDDYYGMAPLAAAAQRVDVDNSMRQFTASFFENAGVPAGILNIKQTLEDDMRENINDQYRQNFGGARGWHSLMVVEGSEATYQQLGMPVGERGLAMPSLDEIDEARIPMVFGVPLELIGARLGMVHGNRSTTKEARASFWDETLVPLYTEISEAITLGMREEYDDIDYFAFDYADVKALQEDEDAKHTRIREDMGAGVISREEAREALGYDPTMKTDDTLMLAGNIVPWPLNSDEPLGATPPPDPNALPDPNASPDFPGLGAGAPAAAGSQNGTAH